MGYQAKQFVFNASAVGRGNVLANQVNQFLALNPGVSPVSMSTSWREGRSKATQSTATLIFRLGGASTRWWAFEMAGAANTEPEDQLAYFLANNPTFIPTIILQVGSQGAANRWRRLLVITADASYAQLGGTNRGLPATPSGAVAEAAFGTYWDKVDATRPPTAALNMGNGTWPLGGVNFLAPALGNNPDLNLLGGIAPLCQSDAFTPPADPVIEDLCDGCFPDDVQATTTTSTTSTTTTSTTSSTTSTSTSTTSTSTSTTTSTTSTTSTSTTTSTTTTTTTSTTTTTAAACPIAASGSVSISVAPGGSTVYGPFAGKPALAAAACCYTIAFNGSVGWNNSNGAVSVGFTGPFRTSCGGSVANFSFFKSRPPDSSPLSFAPVKFLCDATTFTISVINSTTGTLSGGITWNIAVSNPTGC